MFQKPLQKVLGTIRGAGSFWLSDLCIYSLIAHSLRCLFPCRLIKRFFLRCSGPQASVFRHQFYNWVPKQRIGTQSTNWARKLDFRRGKWVALVAKFAATEIQFVGPIGQLKSETQVWISVGQFICKNGFYSCQTRLSFFSCFLDLGSRAELKESIFQSKSFKKNCFLARSWI